MKRYWALFLSTSVLKLSMFRAHHGHFGVRIYRTVDGCSLWYKITPGCSLTLLAAIGGTTVPTLSRRSAAIIDCSCVKDHTLRAKTTLSVTEASNNPNPAATACRPSRSLTTTVDIFMACPTSVLRALRTNSQHCS